MDFDGPKTARFDNGFEHPNPKYVQWLEQRVMTLNQSLLTVRNQLKIAQRESLRSFRQRQDFVAYDEED